MLDPEEIHITLTDKSLAGANHVASVTTRGAESPIQQYAQEIGKPEIFAKSLLCQLQLKILDVNCLLFSTPSLFLEPLFQEAAVQYPHFNGKRILTVPSSST